MKKTLWVILACLLIAACPMKGQESHEFTYQPPPCVGNVFNDVTCGGMFDAWIEQLAYEGITTGISLNPPLYGPENLTKRGQDAVFILKLEWSLLNRFGTGQFSCPSPQAAPVNPNWAICSTTVYDDAIHAESTVMVTYNTRASDTQIPPRVFNVVEGGFSVEIQTNTTASYLSFAPGNPQRSP